MERGNERREGTERRRERERGREGRGECRGSVREEERGFWGGRQLTDTPNWQSAGHSQIIVFIKYDFGESISEN